MNEGGTRERLLAATIEAIAEHGEQGVRVRDIAAAVGVTEPSIYHFFGSREGLVDAAQVARYTHVRGVLTEGFRAAVRECSSVGDFRQLIIDFLPRVYAADRASWRAVRIEVLGSAQSRPRLAQELVAAQRAASRRIAEPISYAQRKGWVRYDIDPEALATWLLGQLNGRVLADIDPESVDGDAWDRVSTDALLAFLTAAPATVVGDPVEPVAIESFAQSPGALDER